MNKGLFFFIFCLDSLPSDSSQKRPEKKQQSGGTYKTKEQIQKAPTDDHPCNLTRTSVKISFPALKSETFVNLLGYKEPNLIYLWRCRGVCSSSSRPVACVATKTSQKTVTMAFRTHLTKQDSKELRVGKERVKEVVLEEDVECGCHCAGISPNHCKGHFDEHLCECQCLGQAMEEAQLACEADQQGSFWDKRSCSCKSKSISPRGVNRPLSNPGCLEVNSLIISKVFLFANFNTTTANILIMLVMIIFIMTIFIMTIFIMTMIRAMKEVTMVQLCLKQGRCLRST